MIIVQITHVIILNVVSDPFLLSEYFFQACCVFQIDLLHNYCRICIPVRIATRVRVSLSHHACIFRDDTVNIHRTSRHALHLLSSKITSPSMAKRRAHGVVLENGANPSRGALSRPSCSNGGAARSGAPHYGNG